MEIIQTMRLQKAVYWARTGLNHHGKYTYAAPVEVDVRWEDGSSEFRTLNGVAVLFQCTVYVDRQMQLGDVLKKGALESNTPNDPTGVQGAYPIQRFSEMPDLQNIDVLYTAFL